MTEDRDAHIKGILRLVDPNLKDRAKWLITSAKTKPARITELANLSLHPKFTVRPARGERSNDALLKRLRQLGASLTCYVIATDNDKLNDSFQDLETMINDAPELFNHDTILSCVAGRLALHRGPHHDYITSIIYRPD
jgi:hypothetical protein